MPNSLSELQQPSILIVKVASGRNDECLGQIDVVFEINEPNFEDVFFLLSSMNSVVAGNAFFRKYSFENSPAENLLEISEWVANWMK